MSAYVVKTSALADIIHKLEAAGSIVKHVDHAGRKSVVFAEAPFRKPTMKIEMRPDLAGLTHAARVGAMETRAKWDRDPLLHSFITDDVVTDGDA